MTHDLLGLFDRFTPRFVRKYADLFNEMERAFGDFIADVEERNFPGDEHTVDMPDDEWMILMSEIDIRNKKLLS